jgi:hypothetical protein
LFSINNKGKGGETSDICAVFVSEKCQEVDYQKTKSSLNETFKQEEELTIFSFSKQKYVRSTKLTFKPSLIKVVIFIRIIKKLFLPLSSSSFVENIQTNAFVLAILCSNHTISLYDIKTFYLIRTITTTSTAMALGTRWIAYPGYVEETKRPRQDSEILEEMISEAHILNGMTISSAAFRKKSAAGGGAYSAIEVAQNVASGFYYLSELGKATIAPYLSSSPANTKAIGNGTIGESSGTPGSINMNPLNAVDPKTSMDPNAGWILIEDLVSGHVVSNFQAHSSPLVALAFDFSGLLLVTCSVKGQKLHLYRIAPSLQTSCRASEQVQILDHLLLYKLQRGITHASIQDISFSQDAKWIIITSAHGTSHMYAIHPEGIRDVSGETHATEEISSDFFHQDSSSTSSYLHGGGNGGNGNGGGLMCAFS